MASRGRPTKYNKDIIRKCWEYLNIKRPSKDEHGELDEVIPSIEGLALYIDVRRETIWAWCQEEDKSDFSNIVRMILEKQGKTLVNKGSTGDFNPTITKLLLSKHKYRESIDVTTDDKPITPTPESIALANRALDEFLKNAKPNTTPNIPV